MKRNAGNGGKRHSEDTLVPDTLMSLSVTFSHIFWNANENQHKQGFTQISQEMIIDLVTFLVILSAAGRTV